MRFFIPFAMLAAVVSAMPTPTPTTTTSGEPDHALVGLDARDVLVVERDALAEPTDHNAISETWLDKRDETYSPDFTFNNKLRGAVLNMYGVAFSFTYNAVSGWLVHVHNHLTTKVVANVLANDKRISEQILDAGKEFSWYVGFNLVKEGDKGQFMFSD